MAAFERSGIVVMVGVLSFTTDCLSGFKIFNGVNTLLFAKDHEAADAAANSDGKTNDSTNNGTNCGGRSALLGSTAKTVDSATVRASLVVANGCGSATVIAALITIGRVSV